MIRIFFTFGLLLSFSLPALAGYELYARKSIRVYEKRTDKSRMLRVIHNGERVRISPKKYGSWRKVLIIKNGRKQAGYVRTKDLKGSKIRRTKKSIESAKERAKVYRTRTGIGLPITASYTLQSGRDIVDSGDNTHVLSSMSGMAVFFGLYGDFPMGESNSLRVNLTLRKGGRAGTVIPSMGQETALKQTDTFFGLGGMYRMYSSPTSSFWWGFGAEIAKLSKVELLLADQSTLDTSAASATFISALVGLGQDFHVTGSFFINLELRAIAVVNTTPMIFGAEMVVAPSMTF